MGLALVHFVLVALLFGFSSSGYVMAQMVEWDRWLEDDR